MEQMGTREEESGLARRSALRKGPSGLRKAEQEGRGGEMDVSAVSGGASKRPTSCWLAESP